MMTSAFCSAVNCGSKYGNEGVTLHRFPVEKISLLSKWLAAVDRSNWLPTKNHYICSLHFTDDKFIEKSGYRFLKYDAVPSKFHVLPRPKEILPKYLPYKLFTVKDVEHDNFKGFIVEIKVGIESEDDFKKWLKIHEQLAKVSYVLVQRFPKTKQLAFKAEFNCRHSTNCPAKLLIRIRTIDPKIPRLKDTDPLSHACTIVLCHLHNHPVPTTMLKDPETQTTEDVSEEIKIKFVEMFKGMYTAEEALATHHEDIKDEYPDEYENVMKDKYNCPDEEWVKKLYNELTKDMGEVTSESMLDSLAADVRLVNGEKGKAKLHKIENDIIIALCTPLMERAHSLQASGEVVFLDSSGFLEKCKCYVFILMSYSCTEGLPLGVLITTSISESILVSGFQLLANLLPERAFGPYGSLGPEAFLVDNNAIFQSSLKAVFPESTVLLCSFAMLKSLWHSLWNKESQIAVEDRCYLFSMIHELTRSKSSEEFEIIYERISTDEIATKYAEFQNYFKEIGSLSEKWAVSFKNLILDKDKDVSSVEIASHVLKDKIYLTKAYNLAQLFRYFTKDVDIYYTQKIIHCINNTLKKFIHYSYKQELRNIENFEIEPLPTGQYKITHSKTGNTYFADMDLWVCSCALGIIGSRCKHQYAVYVLEKLDFVSAVPPDNSIKKELHWIATNSAINSFSSIMETESMDSDIMMEDDDYEYDPRQEAQKKTIIKTKGPKKSPTPKDEAKIILNRVIRDIMNKYENNSIAYHEAIVSFALNYQALSTDKDICWALMNFGASLN